MITISIVSITQGEMVETKISSLLTGVGSVEGCLVGANVGSFDGAAVGAWPYYKRERRG